MQARHVTPTPEGRIAARWRRPEVLHGAAIVEAEARETVTMGRGTGPGLAWHMTGNGLPGPATGGAVTPPTPARALPFFLARILPPEASRPCHPRGGPAEHAHENPRRHHPDPRRRRGGPDVRRPGRARYARCRPRKAPRARRSASRAAGAAISPTCTRSPENFLSQNPHFAKSALSRYTQWDFLDLVQRHGIAWHEKTLGQLFCDGSAKADHRRAAGRDAASRPVARTEIGEIAHDGSRFRVALTREGTPVTVTARNLVVATGGKSIPKMGATGLGYRVAQQFGHQADRDPPRPRATDLRRDAQGRLPPAGRGLCLRPRRLQRDAFRRGDAVHPSRPLRAGDPADLLLLARGRHAVGAIAAGGREPWPPCAAGARRRAPRR